MGIFSKQKVNHGIHGCGKARGVLFNLSKKKVDDRWAMEGQSKCERIIGFLMDI